MSDGSGYGKGMLQRGACGAGLDGYARVQNGRMVQCGAGLDGYRSVWEYIWVYMGVYICMGGQDGAAWARAVWVCKGRMVQCGACAVGLYGQRGYSRAVWCIVGQGCMGMGVYGKAGWCNVVRNIRGGAVWVCDGMGGQ